MFAFADQIVEFVGDVFDGEGPRIVTTPPPPPVQEPPTTIILEEGVAQAPRGDVRGVFTPDDYPTASLRAEEEGTVRAIVSVGTDGVPTACDVTQSSGYARLDATTCSIILERARFAPALDAEGQPVEGTYSTPPIRWEIPSS
nr:energy transducer TonB [Sphingomicrobium sp. B8]